VILSIGPYFGTGANEGPTAEGPVSRFADMVEGGRIFERGYAWVQVDSRGFGASDGCYDYGGTGEQMDATSAVEWASEQPWSNGNVGMWGKSYDAWTQVMALAHKPEGLEAAVVQSPIDDRYKIAFMNGVHYNAGWYATPALYAAYDLQPQSVNDSSPEEFLYPTKGTATDPHCYAENPVASAAFYDRNNAYWREGEISRKARKARVPIMWSHGFNDANTKPDNFLSTWRGYRGWHRGWFGQWDHVRGNESELVGREGFLEEAMTFFDHYLKGEPLPEYPGNVEVQDGEGAWRTEEAWPPKDADYDLGSIPVKTGAYTDGLQASSVWTFTQPAPYDVRFAGTPIVDVNVTTTIPHANLLARIYDVAPDGDATFIQRGAYRIVDAGTQRVTFELFPQDWVLREGHRYGVILTNTDSWFQPHPTQGTVTINEGSKVELPFLLYEREANLEGGPAEEQGDIQHLAITPETIAANEVEAQFPPEAEKAPKHDDDDEDEDD
jgi:predicted acyl esterase